MDAIGRRYSGALSIVAVAGVWLGPPAYAQSLRGSVASLDAQNERAALNDFTFLATGVDIKRFVRAGLLEPVHGGRDYVLHDVSHPVARPEVRVFIERLSEQYRRGCGEALVVTSLTRPITEQPENASPRSVHPTGMAVDLRHPKTLSCRRWLERTLLGLEARGVLDVTLEHSPTHLHVALYPRSYATYVARLMHTAVTAVTASQRYIVKASDTLWAIAQKFGVTLATLRAGNRLSSDLIRVGQVLAIPHAAAKSAKR